MSGTFLTPGTPEAPAVSSSGVSACHMIKEGVPGDYGRASSEAPQHLIMGQQ